MTTRRKLATASMLLFLAGAWILASFREEEEKPTLSGALQLWADVFRDMDHLRIRFGRSSDRQEQELGALLANSLQDKVVHDERLQAYLHGVGTALVPHVRRKSIPYRFYIVELPTVDAFALPGGHVFITRSMLDVLQTEAELAGLLARQIADIDLGYCNGRFQNQAELQKLVSRDPVKVAQFAYALIASGPSSLLKSGGSQDMDAHSIMLVAQARYHPKHLIAFEDRMREFQEAAKGGKVPPKFMLEEFAAAIAAGLESYLTTKRPSSERISELLRSLAKNESGWAGKKFYAGRSNHADRISRSDSDRDAEWRVYEEPPAFQPYLNDRRYGAFKAIAADPTSGLSAVGANQPTPDEAVGAALSEGQQMTSRCVVYSLGDRVVFGKTNDEMEEEKALYFNTICIQKPAENPIVECTPNPPGTDGRISSPDEAAGPVKREPPASVAQLPVERAPDASESDTERGLRSFLQSPRKDETTFALTEVSFAPGTASITKSSLEILGRIAELLVQYPRSRISVRVQDASSDTKHSTRNATLTTERMNSLREVFVRNGVALSRIKLKGGKARRLSTSDARMKAGVWISVTGN